MFHGDIHQMRLKNSPFFGEFFSFHVNTMALILFLLERACQDARHHSFFCKLVSFLSAKGEHMSHDSRNTLKTVIKLPKYLYIQ